MLKIRDARHRCKVNNVFPILWESTLLKILVNQLGRKCSETVLISIKPNLCMATKYFLIWKSLSYRHHNLVLKCWIFPWILAYFHSRSNLKQSGLKRIEGTYFGTVQKYGYVVVPGGIYCGLLCVNPSQYDHSVMINFYVNRHWEKIHEY